MTGMVVLPAIDIQEGKCVRLTKGDFSTSAQVAADCLATAQAFYRQGARWIHMVDLDGARQGRRVNAALFEQVARKTGLRVELGGGIRDRETVEYYLQRGIERVILGSAAIKNPAFVAECAQVYGSRIAVGIDARNGYASAEGWLSDSAFDYVELAKRMEQAGVRTLIYTDITKDGTLGGISTSHLSRLSGEVSCAVIASGGVRDLADIRAAKELGLAGVICGKSLYEGTLDLSQALSAAQ